MIKERILVLDDDICFEEQLQRQLLLDGVFVESVETFSVFYDKLKDAKDYLAAVISLEQIRKEPEWRRLNGILRRQNIPVFYLDSKKNILDELALLKAGASDYFWKDEDIRVIAARILVRTSLGWLEDEKKLPDVFENENNYTIYIGKKVIAFTRLEYQMFHILWKHCGEVVSREFLYNKLWSNKLTKDMRVVDTTIKRVRHKLQDTPLVILSKYRLGYLCDYV